MKNENYTKEYNYGFKIGRYEAKYKINMRVFKRMFGDDYKEYKDRIKWLSFYEMKVLLDLLLESFHYEKCERTDGAENKNKIIELLK